MTDKEAIEIIEDLKAINNYRLSKKLDSIDPETRIKRIQQLDRMVVKLENCYLDSNGKNIIKCGSVFFRTMLVPEFIGYESRKLAKMFLWLKENYKPFRDRFPQVPDFLEAQEKTSNFSPSTYTPSSRKGTLLGGDPEAKEMIKELIKKFSI